MININYKYFYYTSRCAPQWPSQKNSSSTYPVIHSSLEILPSSLPNFCCSNGPFLGLSWSACCVIIHLSSCNRVSLVDPIFCFSVIPSCPTLCNTMGCSTPGFPVLHHLPEIAQTRIHWVSDAIQTTLPLPPASSSAFYLSQHLDLFQWVDSCIRWPKYWSFSFSISPSNDCSGLISFRMDWFDLLAVQGTLRSLL